ncbi:MAG TPA: integrase, partial [Candidatus Hydrogenedentes bacterium]|nr:integrase [Candidatus Hydrogenedentota bacterium]
FEHSRLNHFCCLSLKQLDCIVHVWLHYYHTQRPHQGVDIGNKVLDPSFRLTGEGKIRHKRQLGGIVSY